MSERCGFVAVVGRPNVGKSTFVNALVGQKISIVSHRRQTTRGIVRAVCDYGDAQLVLLDSPGWQTRHSGGLNRRLNKSMQWVVASADVVVLMLSPRWHEEDAAVLSQLPPSAVVVAAINKTDLLEDKKVLLPFIDALRGQRDFAAIVPMCALRRRGVETLATEIAELLPPSPALFAAGGVAAAEDRNFLLGEFLREKMFLVLGDELPYSIGVVARQESETADHNSAMARVSATIYVERDSQKAIVIGKNGGMLKKLGSAARRDMERILGRRVFLDARVVVRASWRRDGKLLTQMRIGAPD